MSFVEKKVETILEANFEQQKDDNSGQWGSKSDKKKTHLKLHDVQDFLCGFITLLW